MNLTEKHSYTKGLLMVTMVDVVAQATKTKGLSTYDVIVFLPDVIEYERVKMCNTIYRASQGFGRALVLHWS